MSSDSKENPREKSERVREKERRRSLEKKKGEKDKIIILSYSEYQRTTINEKEILGITSGEEYLLLIIAHVFVDDTRRRE